MARRKDNPATFLAVERAAPRLADAEAADPEAVGLRGDLAAVGRGAADAGVAPVADLAVVRVAVPAAVPMAVRD